MDDGVIDAKVRPFINNPLVYSEHWPRKGDSSGQAARNELISFGDSSRKQFMSLYHGDFEQIGHELAYLTNGFEDFTLLANVPYGH